MTLLVKHTCPRCDGRMLEFMDIYRIDQTCWYCGIAGPADYPDPIPVEDLCSGSGQPPKTIETSAASRRTKTFRCNVCGQARFLIHDMISPHLHGMTLLLGPEAAGVPCVAAMPVLFSLVTFTTGVPITVADGTVPIVAAL